MTTTKNSDIVKAAVDRVNERLEDHGAFDDKNLGAGVSWPVIRDPLAILRELDLKLGDVIDREQLVLIGELHFALERDRELIKTKGQGIKDGLTLAKKLFGAKFGIQLLPEEPCSDPVQPDVSPLAVESDWQTKEHNGRMHTRCWAKNEKGASCMSMVKHTGTPHIFCQRWPHDGYCMAACLLPEDASRRGFACDAPAGEYAKATNVTSRVDFVMGQARERELALLRASKAEQNESGSLMDPEDVERLAELEMLERIVNLPIRATTLLDLCREFDAIDLSECNRRLEAGEPFDAACDETMEKRVAFAAQIEERLGPQFEKFERLYDVRQNEKNPPEDIAGPVSVLPCGCGCKFVGSLRVECSEHLKEQAVRVLIGMIIGAAQEITTFNAFRHSERDADIIERVRNAHARLGVLLS